MRPKTLDSSYLQSLQYSDAAKVLRVRLSDGAVIDYRGVSSRTYNAILAAKSHGEAFIRLVKDKYDFTIVKQAA